MIECQISAHFHQKRHGWRWKLLWLATTLNGHNTMDYVSSHLAISRSRTELGFPVEYTDNLTVLNHDVPQIKIAMTEHIGLALW